MAHTTVSIDSPSLHLRKKSRKFFRTVADAKMTMTHPGVPCRSEHKDLRPQSRFMRQAAIFFLVYSAITCCVAASFDCDKAPGFVEKTICTDSEISRMDIELARLYATEKKRDPSAMKMQKRWLRETRDRCETIECIHKAYIARISEIKKEDPCPVAEYAIEGNWVRERNGFFEEMAFSSAKGEKEFSSWIHHRPEMSGTWDFHDCVIRIDGGTSKMNFEFRPMKLEGVRLYLIDEDERSAIYRKLK